MTKKWQATSWRACSIWIGFVFIWSILFQIRVCACCWTSDAIPWTTLKYTTVACDKQNKDRQKKPFEMRHIAHPHSTDYLHICVSNQLYGIPFGFLLRTHAPRKVIIIIHVFTFDRVTQKPVTKEKRIRKYCAKNSIQWQQQRLDIVKLRVSIECLSKLHLNHHAFTYSHILCFFFIGQIHGSSKEKFVNQFILIVVYVISVSVWSLVPN